MDNGSKPTLTEFLLARIAEDEDLALEAQLSKGYGEWEYAIVNYSGRIQTVRTTGTSPEYAQHISITHDSEGLSDSVSDNAGPHIARHDPARVLAECDAKRKQIAHLIEFMEGDHAPWNEDQLGMMAAVYADHPDYDEAWRP